jgi:hypothetical protein
MLPAVWMDGETFFDDKLDRQKREFKRQREEPKYQVSQQKSAAYGCDAAFKFITGKSESHHWSSQTDGRPTISIRFPRDVTTDDTEPNLDTIDGPNSGDVSWLSGHHMATVCINSTMTNRFKGEPPPTSSDGSYPPAGRTDTISVGGRKSI